MSCTLNEPHDCANVRAANSALRHHLDRACEERDRARRAASAWRALARLWYRFGALSVPGWWRSHYRMARYYRRTSRPESKEER